jgi:hypothetical protein
MRMSASCGKNHQVRDVHDAHPQYGSIFSQQSCRCDYLKGDFDTNAD